MYNNMTILVTKGPPFYRMEGYTRGNMTSEIEYFITLPIPFTGLCNSVRIDKMLAKFKSQERKVHQTNDCDICKVQAKKLSSQIHNADKDLGQDHHMFSRFLNLRFFFPKIFFVYIPLSSSNNQFYESRISISRI